MAWRHRTVADEMRVVGLSRDHSQSQIAQLTGLSKSTVLDVQRKYHLVLRFGRSYSSARFRYAYDEHAWGRVLEALYVEQRLPVDEVARRCGVDRGTIRRRLEALGFRIRSTGESNRGRKRRAYNWRPDLPRCACGAGIATSGETWCAACRRSAARRAAAAA